MVITCSNGLALTVALVALLVLPLPYYGPSLGEPAGPEPPPAQPPLLAALPLQQVAFPTLDLVFAATVVAVGAFTYACEWVQRKLVERRIVKLNAYLAASVERLRAMDAQQEQLEASMRMVNNATSEYNLLLWLLLRQRHCLRNTGPPSNCFFEKQLDDDCDILPYLQSDAF